MSEGKHNRQSFWQSGNQTTVPFQPSKQPAAFLSIETALPILLQRSLIIIRYHHHTIIMRTWAVRTVLVVGFGLIVKETLWQTERKAGTLPAPPAVQQLRPFHKTKANKGSNPPQRTKHYSTQVKFHPLPPHARVMTLDDMPDLANATHILNILDNEDVQNMTWDQAIVGREPIVEALHQAGVQFDLNVLKILPYWSDVQELYGTEPVILGLDQCQAFRRAHPVEQRFVGIAGQHNCGTNAMSKYMMENLIIPENHGVGNGILANVPWHKHGTYVDDDDDDDDAFMMICASCHGWLDDDCMFHMLIRHIFPHHVFFCFMVPGWVDLRSNYMFSAPPEHENVLPVLLVRDPYYWMGSMCESPYLMKWMHSKDHCPNLVRSLEEDEGVPAKTMWGRNERKWDSLAHVWSEFNGEYVDADFPRLVIRFEGASNNCFSVARTCRPAISSCTTHKSYIHSFLCRRLVSLAQGTGSDSWLCGCQMEERVFRLFPVGSQTKEIFQ